MPIDDVRSPRHQEIDTRGGAADAHDLPPVASSAAAPPTPVQSAGAPASRQRRSRVLFVALCVVTAAAVVLAAVLWFTGRGSTSGGQAKTASGVPAAENLPQPIKASPAPPYAADMNSVIAGYPDLQAGATLVDLSSGKTYGSTSAEQMFTAASTGKLISVFCYMHQVELGKATLAQTISGQAAQDIIMRMIVNSDNDAWYKLNKYLSFPAQQAYLDNLGVKAQYVPDDLQISSNAMAKLLTMLYQGKLMNDTNRQIVYGYMARASWQNLIVAALPAGATAYHKYGQIVGVLNDTSIVTYAGHSYVWVIYTNNPAGTTSLQDRQISLIHALTTKVFADITAAQKGDK